MFYPPLVCGKVNTKREIGENDNPTGHGQTFDITLPYYINI